MTVPTWHIALAMLSEWSCVDRWLILTWLSGPVISDSVILHLSVFYSRHVHYANSHWRMEVHHVEWRLVPLDASPVIWDQSCMSNSKARYLTCHSYSCCVVRSWYLSRVMDGSIQIGNEVFGSSRVEAYAFSPSFFPFAWPLSLSALVGLLPCCIAESSVVANCLAGVWTSRILGLMIPT